MPGRLDLTDIYRGDTYTHELNFVDENDDPLPLSSSFAAHIRPSIDSDNFVAITVTETDLANGIITLELTAVQTETLSLKGVWDLENDVSGTVTTLLEGEVTVQKDVTR